MQLPKVRSRHWNFYVAVGVVAAIATLLFAPGLEKPRWENGDFFNAVMVAAAVNIVVTLGS